MKGREADGDGSRALSFSSFTLTSAEASRRLARLVLVARSGLGLESSAGRLLPDETGTDKAHLPMS
jgi:hypothetical protein